MRVAYADPPYIGQARKHYAHEAAAAGRVASEVDHTALITQLVQHDAWALSLGSTTLVQIARLQGPDGCFVLPDDVRVGAWVKPFASFKRGVDPAYAWEPVLFRSARKWSREQWTVREWVSAPITLKRGVSGAKPEVFCRWLFDLLGMTRDDEFLDLFPGSGAVTEAYRNWRAETALEFVG